MEKQTVNKLNNDDNEDDPVDKMIKVTGCLEKHHAVQVKQFFF